MKSKRWKISELDENELSHVSPAAPQIHPHLHTINTPQQLTSRFSRQPSCCPPHSPTGPRCCLRLFPAGVRCRPPLSSAEARYCPLSPTIVQCRFPRYLLCSQPLEWHKIRPKVYKMSVESVKFNFFTSCQQLQKMHGHLQRHQASRSMRQEIANHELLLSDSAVKLTNSKLLNLKLFVHSNMSRY